MKALNHFNSNDRTRFINSTHPHSLQGFDLMAHYSSLASRPQFYSILLV